MSTHKELTNRPLEEFEQFVRDRERRVKQLVRKITHSGESDLNKDYLLELKGICKVSQNDLMVLVHKECMKHLHKDHSQVRVATLRLLDYLFQKSHILRERLLEEFDTFLELTLTVTSKPKVQLKLPPPKKYAALLQELGAKMIHKWHTDFGEGYEKIRYTFRYLREHELVDFSRFQVNSREQLIQRQKMVEQQEKVLTRALEIKMLEFQELKPEFEQILAQLQSLIDILVPNDETYFQSTSVESSIENRDIEMQQHGIASMNQSIHIEFNPYMEVRRDNENTEIVQKLKELKKELINGKLTKLISIEKTMHKRSDQMVETLKEIIDLKNRSTNIVLKLAELKIVNQGSDESNRTKSTTIDDDNSDLDEEFDEVQPKEGLESYIPKSMRFEYGLEPIDPRELADRSRINFNDDNMPTASCSSDSNLVMACNVKLESGKLCPRRDRIKCPFHGRIIPRDHLGVPLDDEERIKEERRAKRLKDKHVPEWQDPKLLAEIKAATGVDLTMPARGKNGRLKKIPNNNLVNPKTCDQTPKQRLQKKLKRMVK